MYTVTVHFAGAIWKKIHTYRSSEMTASTSEESGEEQSCQVVSFQQKMLMMSH